MGEGGVCSGLFILFYFISEVSIRTAEGMRFIKISFRSF